MKRRQRDAAFGAAWRAKHDHRLAPSWSDEFAVAALREMLAPAFEAIRKSWNALRESMKRMWESFGADALEWLESFNVSDQVADLMTIPDPPLVLAITYQGRPYPRPQFPATLPTDWIGAVGWIEESDARVVLNGEVHDD